MKKVDKKFRLHGFLIRCKLFIQMTLIYRKSIREKFEFKSSVSLLFFGRTDYILLWISIFQNITKGKIFCVFFVVIQYSLYITLVDFTEFAWLRLTCCCCRLLLGMELYCLLLRTTLLFVCCCCACCCFSG